MKATDFKLEKMRMNVYNPSVGQQKQMTVEYPYHWRYEYDCEVTTYFRSISAELPIPLTRLVRIRAFGCVYPHATALQALHPHITSFHRFALTITTFNEVSFLLLISLPPLENQALSLVHHYRWSTSS